MSGTTSTPAYGHVLPQQTGGSASGRPGRPGPPERPSAPAPGPVLRILTLPVRAGGWAGRVAPRHVDALVELLELMPEMVDLIVPALRGMGGVGTEIEQLVERFETISQVVEGLPGAGMLRRRGAEQESDAPGG